MPNPMRDKIHYLWITSNDQFTKQSHLFSNPKSFWMLDLNDHLYTTSCVFCGQRIFGVSLPLYSTVRLYWTSSNGTEPTQLNTKCSVDYNHALTPIQCDVLVHMQCNASLHVISRHMYNECYMDNTIHTT